MLDYAIYQGVINQNWMRCQITLKGRTGDPGFGRVHTDNTTKTSV